MRIRPLHLIFAAFGMLLLGTVFLLLSARSAQAVELGPSGVATPDVLTDAVATVTGDLPPAPSVAGSTASIGPVPAQPLPVEQPLTHTGPSAVVGQVDQTLAAAEQPPAPVREALGAIEQPVAAIKDAAGAALDSTNAVPTVVGILAPVAETVGGVLPDIGRGTPIEPILDQLKPIVSAPGTVLTPPGTVTEPAAGTDFRPGVEPSLGFVATPPTAFGLAPTILQPSFLGSLPPPGVVVRVPRVDPTSFRHVDARAAPSPGTPPAREAPGGGGLVASLVGAASAQGLERAGAGFVFAVLIAAVGLLAPRRRFTLLAQVLQAQRFVSVIVRPG